MSEANYDLSKFQEDGYVLLKGFFPEEKAKAAAEWLRSQDLKSMAKSWTDQEPQVDLAVWQNIHKGSDPVADLVGDKSITDFASKIMDQEVYIWSSKVNLKAAWCGTVEYHHQDYAYWEKRGYEKIDMLTCALFLDEHNVHNGGLNVFPGSHKLGYLEHVPFININGLQKFMVPPKRLDELNKENPVVVIDAKPGDLLFFHSGLVHGSAHNISPNPRMIALAQMNTKGNLPDDVQKKTKDYNLWRTQYAVDEAKKRYEYYSEKFIEQKESETILYNSPIQSEEE